MGNSRRETTEHSENRVHDDTVPALDPESKELVPVLELNRNWDGENWQFSYEPGELVPQPPPPVKIKRPIKKEKAKYTPPPLQSLSRQRGGKAKNLIIQPSWISVWGHLALFATLSYVAVRLSMFFPFTVISNSLNLSSFSVNFGLPILILPAGFVLIRAFVRMYDSFAEMNHKSVKLHTGIMSFRSKVVEMEADTLLVVEVSQSPIEKVLNIGTVSVGRFSRKNMEFSMPGVYNPSQVVRIMKKRIKAARIRKAKQSQKSSSELDGEFEAALEEGAI